MLKAMSLSFFLSFALNTGLAHATDLRQIGKVILTCPMGESGFLEISHSDNGKFFAIFAGANGEVSQVLPAFRGFDAEVYRFGDMTLEIPVFQTRELPFPKVKTNFQKGERKAKTLICERTL